MGNGNTTKRITIMEVCGTHTMAIARHGLRKLFPRGIRLVSGPGCPVCVTPGEDIDYTIAVGGIKGVIIATFGDMLHVPGSRSSLEKERAAGADVRVVYSPMDALEIAQACPGRPVIFLGVGFETTAPTVAATVIAAKKKGIRNFYVIPLFKTIPRALRALLDMSRGRAAGARIDGFLLPGHVSTIIGSLPYGFIAGKFGISGVIAGFEPRDILESVERIATQVRNGEPPAIDIQYERTVRPEGNRIAQQLLDKVFVAGDSRWRAVGVIKGSGLMFRPPFERFDARKEFPLALPPVREPQGCRCGDILLGLKTPGQCGFFGKRCTPSNPVGPCMVSSEGSCAAEYKYGRGDGGQ